MQTNNDNKDSVIDDTVNINEELNNNDETIISTYNLNEIDFEYECNNSDNSSGITYDIEVDELLFKIQYASDKMLTYAFTNGTTYVGEDVLQGHIIAYNKTIVSINSITNIQCLVHIHNIADDTYYEDNITMSITIDSNATIEDIVFLFIKDEYNYGKLTVKLNISDI